MADTVSGIDSQRPRAAASQDGPGRCRLTPEQLKAAARVVRDQIDRFEARRQALPKPTERSGRRSDV